MTTADCGYTHLNGSYINQSCVSGSPYCCQATADKYCSTSECSTEDSASFQLTTIVFWGILGGFLFVSFVIMVVIYVFCYSRNPGNCLGRNPLDDLLEIPGQKENSNNNASSSRVDRNTTNNNLNQSVNQSPRSDGQTILTGHQPRNVQIKLVQETRTISVTPQSTSPEEHFATSLDHVKLVANDRRRRFAPLEHTGSSTSPSISNKNAHHVTSIATME